VAESGAKFASRAPTLPSRWAPGCLSILVLLLSVSRVQAAELVHADHSGATFLAQIVLLLLVGRLLGEAMQRVGQPAVMGQLIAGILLGPSVFGVLWPRAYNLIFSLGPEQKKMLDAMSQFGILMLLLLTGMETDVALVRKVRRAAIFVSLAGIAVPFACGFALGEFLPVAMLSHPEQRLVTALFLGTALSIASVKIVAAVIREMNFTRRNVGQIILAAAIIDDTVGWILISIIFGIALHGGLDAAALTKGVLAVVAFLVFSITAGRRLVFTLIRWSNDYLVSEVPVITTILVIMGVMALITHRIGVHTALGAFVAGMLVGQSPILTRHIDEQLRGLIVALFMPIFFAVAGLSANLSILRDPTLLMLALGLILIASIGKFGGAFLGGALGGLTRRESLALACGMNARGSTEVIVASIGLSMGALTQDMFTVIVTMAIATTMAMPPMLRWALARLPLRPEEKARLEREAVEAKGFVSNLERLLLAVDDSPNGKFASRLVGALAGSRHILTTVLRLRDKPESVSQPTQDDSTVAVARAAAGSARAASDENTSGIAMPDIRALNQKGAKKTAVAKEARKGYDLLVIGVHTDKGAFPKKVSRIAEAFDGPLAIVAGLGAHLEDPLRSKLSILVPITGTQHSRRAAEVALAIAKATDSPVAAIYVSRGRKVQWRRRLRSTFALATLEEAIVKEAVTLAEQHGVELRTTVRSDRAAEHAILQEAQSGNHNLIVFGVSRRPGATLFFGHVAAAVLQRSDRSMLFVSS
jgi:Kef-type K+ transport system membrane component KefB/nucleotide-binding universal stress UspA family protein